MNQIEWDEARVRDAAAGQAQPDSELERIAELEAHVAELETRANDFGAKLVRLQRERERQVAELESAVRGLQSVVNTFHGWIAEISDAELRPHSRACGTRQHDHGPDCHSNCPTCGGRVPPWPWQVPMATWPEPEKRQFGEDEKTFLWGGSEYVRADQIERPVLSTDGVRLSWHGAEYVRMDRMAEYVKEREPGPPRGFGDPSTLGDQRG